MCYRDRPTLQSRDPAPAREPRARRGRGRDRSDRYRMRQFRRRQSRHRANFDETDLARPAATGVPSMHPTVTSVAGERVGCPALRCAANILRQGPQPVVIASTMGAWARAPSKHKKRLRSGETAAPESESLVLPTVSAAAFPRREPSRPKTQGDQVREYWPTEDDGMRSVHSRAKCDCICGGEH